MKLHQIDYGKSRGTHFSRANAALLEALSNDSKLLSALEKINPDILKDITDPKTKSRLPQSFTWQHAHSSQTFGKSGVMQLVPRSQHTPGSEFWEVLHPGNKGGYSEWAIPNGAPKNSR